jgi:hypothetical protein
MQTIENLKALIKETLLKDKGDLKLRVHKEITNYANQVGIDGRKLSKLIQEVDASINWEFIAQQEINVPKRKTKTISTKEQKSIPLENHYKQKLDAPDLIKRKITLKRIYIAVCCIFFVYIVLQTTTKLAPSKGITMFSCAEVLNLRESEDTNSSDNIIRNIFYADSVEVISINNGVAYCKVGSLKGYLSVNYLLPKEDFYLLDGIFADKTARLLVKTTRGKKALLSYYKSRGLVGKLSSGYDTIVSPHNMWQLSAAPSTKYYNTVAHVNNLSDTLWVSGLACIISNISTNQRRFLLFGFTKNEEPELLYEETAPSKGNIKTVQELSTGVYKVRYSK